METLSYEEFKKRYGTVGLAQAKKPESFFDKAKDYITSNVANSFKGGIQQIKTGAQQINPQGGNNPFRGGLNVAGGVLNTAFSPIAPITRPIAKGVEMAADKISDNPSVQKFANTGVGQQVARTAGDVANVANIAGTIGGSKLAIQGMNKLATRTPKTPFGVGGFDPTKIESGAKNIFQGAKDLAGTKGVINDILPTRKGIINDQVTKALDLTAGDTSNIFKSTGNDVGMFLADRKLLGKTVKETQQLIDDYKNSNFTEVRKNISAVKNTYKASQVPRYTEALQELLKETAEVPGLQKSAAEIRTLLKKKDIELPDVQRVKELVDDHYSLYKNTGDPKLGQAKKGMVEIRRDLRAFLENEVKNNTGVDIAPLNNNVATAKSIADAVKTRSTRGLTRSNIKLSDMGVFGAGSLIGTPLFGLAAVFAKKLIESPSVQLKIARYLADLPSDARARIQAELVSGKIPDELREVIKNTNGDQ